MLLAVLLVSYYAGGYVAGRMSRFDGGRQGVAMWFVGLLVTIVAAALGWVAGDQYNLFDRVDVPRIPIPSDDVTLGGIVTGVLVLLGTLLAAILGGIVGRRYHDAGGPSRLLSNLLSCASGEAEHRQKLSVLGPSVDP